VRVELLRIVWWGHACFELIYEDKRLVIDPHDGGSIAVNLPPPRTKADYVLVTHPHYDHDAVETVSKEGTAIVRAREGEFQLGPFRIKGIRLPHDEFEGRVRGMVTAYLIEAGPFSVLHLGDLGRPLTEREMESIGSPDIVLVPVGGVYTLHPADALESVTKMGARIVVPMHYWFPGCQLPLEPLEIFLHHARRLRVVRLESNQLELRERDDLPPETTVVVLKIPVGEKGPK
jgi:L-ascorbate metabolism protein UlaG (beta-lactamase superfamily)